MKQRDLELAASVLETDLKELNHEINILIALEHVFHRAIARCKPDKNGSYFTKQYQAVKAAYTLLKNHYASFGYLQNEPPILDPPKLDRSEPAYKANLKDSTARVDPMVFNALFEASQKKTSTDTATPSEIAPCESSESCRNYQNVHEDMHLCLPTENPLSSTNAHYAIDQFEHEAQTHVVINHLDKSELDAYREKLRDGTQRFATSQLKKRAKQLQNEYASYVRTTCNRDQPIFCRARR